MPAPRAPRRNPRLAATRRLATLAIVLTFASFISVANAVADPLDKAGRPGFDKGQASTTVEVDIFSVAARARTEGSFEPGVRLRPEMRCRIVVMTIVTRVDPAGLSLICTAFTTTTVYTDCIRLSLSRPAALADSLCTNDEGSALWIGQQRDGSMASWASLSSADRSQRRGSP